MGACSLSQEKSRRISDSFSLSNGTQPHRNSEHLEHWDRLDLQADWRRVYLQHQQDLQALHVNAAVQQLHRLVQVVLRRQRDHQLQQRQAQLSDRSKPAAATARLWPYLVVGVVEVQGLTKGHPGFNLQVLQLQRPRELQDPAERDRGQRSGRSGPCNRTWTLTSSLLWTRTWPSRRSVETKQRSWGSGPPPPPAPTDHATWFLGDEALGFPNSDRKAAGRLERCSSAKSCMMEFRASCSSGRSNGVMSTAEPTDRLGGRRRSCPTGRLTHHGAATDPAGSDGGLSHQRDSLLLQQQITNRSSELLFRMETREKSTRHITQFSPNILVLNMWTQNVLDAALSRLNKNPVDQNQQLVWQPRSSPTLDCNMAPHSDLHLDSHPSPTCCWFTSGPGGRAHVWTSKLPSRLQLFCFSTVLPSTKLSINMLEYDTQSWFSINLLCLGVSGFWAVGVTNHDLYMEFQYQHRK